MDKKIVVFDFDKTLTYKDTLFGFYISIVEKNYKLPFKISFYFFLMILFKFKLISNDFLKKTGFKIFIKGKKISFLEKKAKLYVKKINFNLLFNSFDFENASQKVIIISASYEVYLKYIFKENVQVIGSRFISENGFATEFDYNCYSEYKSKILKQLGYNSISILYTDSFSDFSLAKLSDCINIVRKDNIYKCYSLIQFKKYFR